MTKFERRHYVFLARVAAEMLEYSPRSVEILIAALQANNPRFKESLFRKAIMSHD